MTADVVVGYSWQCSVDSGFRMMVGSLSSSARIAYALFDASRFDHRCRSFKEPSLRRVCGPSLPGQTPPATACRSNHR